MKQVDVSILEVGLGGKFDATNVVCIFIVFDASNMNIEIYHSMWFRMMIVLYALKCMADKLMCWMYCRSYK